MSDIRHIFASREVSVVVTNSPSKTIEIYSFFPCDKASCDCQKVIVDFKKKLSTLPANEKQALMAQTERIICSRSKKGMKRYRIVCKTCGEILGYCWATDNTLKDWCDFHYTQWTDGKEWHGCLTPHVSPITEQLCLECCCGADTRDFRANMTLPISTAMEIEEENQVGRDFGTADSKFAVRTVSANVIPFKKG